jgi:hypothetical protein
MTLNDIKTKWNIEKGFYRLQEVCTGVQSFIKACLESEALFALKEGSLSSKRDYRHNEFIHEHKAKEGRLADFVLYITRYIVIPLEAECYQNIDAGIKQLFNYQKDFDKHYCILTDGYTWRFYNNNIYRQFSLDQIITATSFFLAFWKEYIKSEFYYLSFFEPRGQLSLLKNTDRLAWFSGFYMSLILHEKYVGKNKGYFLFISNRVLRIYPVYWVGLFSLITLSVLKYFFYETSDITIDALIKYYSSLPLWLSILIFAGDFLRNITLIITTDYFGIYPQPVHLFIQQAWTLQVELIFKAYAVASGAISILSVAGW